MAGICRRERLVRRQRLVELAGRFHALGLPDIGRRHHRVLWKLLLELRIGELGQIVLAGPEVLRRERQHGDRRGGSGRILADHLLQLFRALRAHQHLRSAHGRGLLVILVRPVREQEPHRDRNADQDGLYVLAEKGQQLLFLALGSRFRSRRGLHLLFLFRFINHGSHSLDLQNVWRKWRIYAVADRKTQAGKNG